MRTRSILGVGALAAVIVLTACNPILDQPTAVRDFGVSRSGYLTYTGDARGWLEVQVRSSADDDVTVLAFGRDETRERDWMHDSWCYFAIGPTPAWSDGSSLGYQRLERIGPGTELKLQFSAPTEGLTFDARVVDDDGGAVGDLAHEVPTPGFESISGAICPG